YASDCFASAGLTWVQDAWVEEAEVGTWLEAYQAGALNFGADLALWCDPNKWRDQLDGFRQSRERVARDGGGQLTARTIKFFADGVVESGTAAMLEPYCDCPHSKGLPNWDRAELIEAVTAIDALGFTAHIHAIGDAGVRNALDAMEAAGHRNPTRDRRWVIAHTQLVNETDLTRFAELGVIANFEPYWSKWDAWQYELSEPRLGTARTNRQFQTATLLKLGAPVSFGSDWPVTTYAPLDGIQVAVTRQNSPEEPSWVPQECISVDEALSCYTAGVAFQAGRDDAGIIRPGAVADLVLLGADLRQVPPMTISAIAVLGTWRAGQRTFTSG
ncbi:MAG: amidohydrolase, partial [Actinomycetales bacterium]